MNGGVSWMNESRLPRPLVSCLNHKLVNVIWLILTHTFNAIIFTRSYPHYYWCSLAPALTATSYIISSPCLTRFMSCNLINPTLRVKHHQWSHTTVSASLYHVSGSRTRLSYQALHLYTSTQRLTLEYTWIQRLTQVLRGHIQTTEVFTAAKVTGFPGGEGITYT